MKRILSLFIATLVLFCAFSFTSLAVGLPDGLPENDYTTVLSKTTKITFSDDLKTLYFGKEEYVRCSAENIYNEILSELNNKINLSPEQKKEIKKISLTASENGALIGAYIDFTDGASLSCTYIKTEYVEEYNRILADDFDDCEVDFSFPEHNIVKLSADVLSGEKVTIKDPNNRVNDYFSVIVSTKDEKIVVEVGLLIILDDEYCYLSYDELGTNSYEYNIYDVESVTAHKITDKEAVALLTEAQENYYNSDFGFFYNDDFTTKIADIFLILIFGILPLAGLVVFTIFAVRSKQIYRKMCAVIAVISAAEIIVFTIIALMVT